MPLKKAAALAAEIHGVKKNALYKYALEQQGSKPNEPLSASFYHHTLYPQSGG